MCKAAKKRMKTICENLDDEVKEKLCKSESEKKNNLWESGWWNQTKEKVCKEAKEKVKVCENLDDEVKGKLCKSKSKQKTYNLWESEWWNQTKEKVFKSAKKKSENNFVKNLVDDAWGKLRKNNQKRKDESKEKLHKSKQKGKQTICENRDDEVETKRQK